MWFRVFILIIIASLGDAARILGYFAAPAFSHQITFRKLTQELARRGHDVTVITTIPAFSNGQSNVTEIDVHDISFDIWRKDIMPTATENNAKLLHQMHSFINVLPVIHEQQLLKKEIKDIIENKNDTFDLLLLELCFRPAWVLSHVIKAPTIFISSFGGLLGVYEAAGAPNHPFLYPRSFRQKLYNLTFWEKITEYYIHYQVEKILDNTVEMENELNRFFFGPDTPSMTELIKNMEMLFLNVHPIWEGNRPVPPNVVFMGGIHQKPEEKLPMELKSYLDLSQNGVIYISFGTNIIPSLLPPEKVQIFVNVFSKLSYDILWKYDEDELPGRSKNIRIEKWLPQSDLLRHPKVKLFITQGGLQSTDEAITAGVPLIGVPMFGDQWYNTEHYVHHKIGVKIDMETITEEKLMNAVNSITSDESYRHNIIRLRDLMNDQPESPLDRAVWWAEHVIRHKGAKHLKASGAHITWVEYYEIELILILFVTLLSLILLFSVIVYFMWKCVSRNITTAKFKRL